MTEIPNFVQELSYEEIWSELEALQIRKEYLLESLANLQREETDALLNDR